MLLLLRVILPIIGTIDVNLSKYINRGHLQNEN